MVFPIGSIIARNYQAQGNWMNNADSTQASFGNTGASGKALLNAEQGRVAEMSKNSLISKTSGLMAETARKINDDNIKRTYNTFTGNNLDLSA